MCVCVFFPFILDVRLVDVPAGVTQEKGHTGFLIHLSFVVLALNFSREKDLAVPFSCLNSLSVMTFIHRHSSALVPYFGLACDHGNSFLYLEE